MRTPQPSPPPPAAPPHDVIIVGAGMAGVSAASTFRRHGLSSFALLEASSRLGGRVHTASFGAPYVRRLRVERGASFLSGGGRASHPLERAARRLSLRTARIAGGATNLSGWAAYNASGSRVDPHGRVAARAARVVACVRWLSYESEADMSIAAAAARCAAGRAAPPHEAALEAAMLWQSFAAESGLPASRQSLWGSVPDPTFSWFGPDEWMVIDPRGFEALLLEVASSRGSSHAERPPPLFANVHLHTHVNRISYSCSGVVVHSSDGRRYAAQYALVTLPIGVLQAAPALFAPRLPDAQAAALRKFTMSNYTKIYAQWREVWWDDELDKWLVASAADEVGPLTACRNLNHASLLPGSRTLLWDLAEPHSSEWEAMDDRRAQQALVAQLRRQFPSRRIPPPAAFLMTRYGRSPLSRGAYSAWSLGMTEEDHATMAAPLRAASHCRPRVFLSGEGMCASLSGYAHAALLAGRRDAMSVLYEVGRVRYRHKSMCDAKVWLPKDGREALRDGGSLAS
ncbi:hypothetical protein AB1Y20_019718 [Prymnesium parvum]|uniref:Amine oxidase domain-containing protein n=1 Tax=Prymnesium parvum TaxID=97485 RepID=A0AB34JRV7_PRYPA